MGFVSITVIAVLSAICLGLAVACVFLATRPPKEIKVVEKEVEGSASELLGKLLSGRAVVVVDVMDQGEVFRYSPKHREG